MHACAHTYMLTHTHMHKLMLKHMNTFTLTEKLCSEKLNVLDFVLHIVITFHIHNVLYLNVS